MRSPATDVVLGIDTATDHAVVGATRGGEVVHQTTVPPGAEGRPRHASELLIEIENAADAAGGWGEVGLLAVGIGPGTFTGLRVGIATVRAIAQARRLSVAPVGTLAALARGIAASNAAAGRLLLPLIDGKRGELFAALEGPNGESIWEPLVIAPGALGERLRAAGVSPLAGGEGSLRFRDQLEAAGVDVLAEADPAHRLAARHVCALGSRVRPVPPEGVTPAYLRRPDAEVWRERRHRDI